MRMNKGHMQLHPAAPNGKMQNYKVQLYFRRRSSACLLLTPFFFLLLCFIANKLLYTTHQTEGASLLARASGGPCRLLRAGSYDHQLQPAVPNSLFLPSTNKEGNPRSKTEAEVNSGRKQLANYTSFPQACKGKLIYIYPLPPEFNQELVERCKVGYKRYCDKWFCIPCNYLDNHGFGTRVPHSQQSKIHKGYVQGETSEGVRLIPESAWYRSDQFAAEVIFYEKMKKHVCVTKNASEANAFYIPFLGGLDVAFVSFSEHTHIRDELTQRLVGWLSGNPIWQANKKAPHFMVLGHVAWDFNRKLLEGDGLPDEGSTTWGTSLFYQPLLSSVTWLLPERKLSEHDMGIPFPTLFHPSSPTDVALWQEEVKKAKRPWLVTFVGGSTRAFTGNNTRTLRIELMKQCKEVEGEMGTLISNSIRRCRAVECISGEEMKRNRRESELHEGESGGVIEDKMACNDEPEEVVRALAQSVFCLQPKGDSATRKGFFDTIVAGCIPVLFANATAYLQYMWHLPASPSSYSVFIPEADILANRVNVVDTLSRIPLAHIQSMQQTVLQLIPHVVYSHPSSSFPDAFSLTLDAFFLHKSQRYR